MLMSGLAGAGRQREIFFDVNYISRVIHEAYQFLNQKLKSTETGTSADKNKNISHKSQNKYQRS